MLLKREIKVNLKSFIIWSFIIISLVLMIIGIYPTIKANADSFGEFLDSFPKEMLDLFSFNKDSFNTVTKWFATEGYLYNILLISCYASLLGGNILSKEKSDKTFEFLLSKPISRKKILRIKLFVVYFYLFILNSILSLITAIGFSVVDNFEISKWFYLNLGPFLISVLFASISFLIASFINKSRKVMAFGLGIVFVNFLILIVSNIDLKFQFLSNFSFFELVSSTNIIENGYISAINILMIIIITIFLNLFTFFLYSKKDIY